MASNEINKAATSQSVAAGAVVTPTDQQPASSPRAISSNNSDGVRLTSPQSRGFNAVVTARVGRLPRECKGRCIEHPTPDHKALSAKEINTANAAASFIDELQRLFNERWLLTILFDLYEGEDALLLREGRLLLCRGKHKQAVVCFTRSAELGCPAAFGHLAQACYEGFGIRRVYRTGAKHAQRGAELNDPLSMAMLSLFHQNGFGGVVENGKRARQLLEQSWHLGSSDVMGCFGRCRLHSLATFTMDEPRSARVLQLAADLGDTIAMTDLYTAMTGGWGLPKDLIRLAELRQRAAEMGNPMAMCDFAHSLKDLVAARKWYQRAADDADFAWATTKLVEFGPAKP